MWGLGADGVKKGHIEVISGNARNNAWYGMQHLHRGNHICSFKITFLSQEDGESVDRVEYDLSNPIQFYIQNLPIVSGLYLEKFCITGSFFREKHDVHQKKNSGNHSLGFILQITCCHDFRSDSVSTLKKPLSVESIYSPILFRMTMT